MKDKGNFAFNCSAEDAEFLVPELGGAVDEQDLLELAEHQCYVRLTSRGQRLPTFSVQLDPPLAPDAEITNALRSASTERYGRDAKRVLEDRRSAVARAITAPTALANATAEESKPGKRNEHRPRKKRSG